MSAGKMHADEVVTDVALVRRLLTAQFPQWADLPLETVRSAGTDHALYRLGDDKVVRMPRIAWATEQADKERRWLPQLAPLLPLAIPVPLAKGEPSEGYPWHWSVYQWLDGENATLDRLADHEQAAVDLARFVTALQGIDTTGGPPAGTHNFFRGVPLVMRDEPTRAALTALLEMRDRLDGFDIEGAAAVWEAALRAPVWDGTPVWVHGDLQSGNLLAVGGRLQAVIDFGGLGVGDPAVDLIVAWNLLTADMRAVFRKALSVDGATWERGRGWALSIGLVALPYYHTTNPSLAQMSRRAIEEVLSDR